MSKYQIIEEIHRPARRNFLRRRTIVKGYADLWQSDLADMQSYKDENDGYRYILIVINCYTKYVWARPLKNKTGSHVRNAFLDILQNCTHRPKNLQTDQGTEYYNKEFGKIMKTYDINHYSTYSTMKASMAERVIRTIKSLLYKKMAMRGKYNWIDIINGVINKYNNTTHSIIGMKPIDVLPTTKLNQYRQSKNEVRRKKTKYRVGDVVRISKYKSIFEKGYTANYTTELFKIRKVNSTYPVTYILEDMNGQPIKGSFYELELLKTKWRDVYLVEKVIRTKGDKALVKWLGFPQQENSWININDVV